MLTFKKFARLYESLPAFSTPIEIQDECTQKVTKFEQIKAIVFSWEQVASDT